MRGSQQNAHAILTAAIVAVTQEWLHVLLQNAIFNLFLQSEAFSQSLFCLLRSKTTPSEKTEQVFSQTFEFSSLLPHKRSLLRKLSDGRIACSAFKEKFYLPTTRFNRNDSTRNY